MRRTCLSIVALAALVAAGILLSGGAAAGEKELKALCEGTWKFLAQEFEGKARPAEDLTKLKITFTGDKFSVTDDGKVIQAGTNKIDGSKKPIQIDATVTEGQGKGMTMLGIYEMNGDTIKACFDHMGKERPTAFTSKAGQMAVVIQREKKEK